MKYSSTVATNIHLRNALVIAARSAGLEPLSDVDIDAGRPKLIHFKIVRTPSGFGFCFDFDDTPANNNIISVVEMFEMINNYHITKELTDGKHRITIFKNGDVKYDCTLVDSKVIDQIIAARKELQT